MPLTLKQHAYSVIRERLLSGGIAPGGRLSDEAFARELGISRSPVREAISQLSSEGLVEHRPRSGAYVRVPTLRELQEVYEARVPLEAFAAAKAAERITSEKLAELTKINEQTRDIVAQCRMMPRQVADATLTQRFLSFDYDLHMLILSAADNERVMKMVADCKILTRVFGHVPVEHDLHLLASTYRQHCQIVRSIQQRDPESARHWMERHIQFAEKEVLRAFPKENGVDVVGGNGNQSHQGA